MSDDKPIFPRSNETDEEEKQRLLWEARQRLEAQEKNFGTNLSEKTGQLCPGCGRTSPLTLNFCPTCGFAFSSRTRQIPVDDVSEVYGPPPMKFDKKPEPDFTMTVYGPPAMNMNEGPDSGDSFVYGPPVMNLNNTPKMPEYVPMPAYGPPPMPIKEQAKSRWMLWLIIGLVVSIPLLIIVAAVIVFVIAYFSRH